MASAAQKVANRQNAQLSTGPSTTAGKEAVSQNATKHGLTGAIIFRDDQDREVFYAMQKQMLLDYKPATITEGELIAEMAQSLWRSRKARLLQDITIDQLAFEPDLEISAMLTKNLELYMRYKTSYDRAYQRYAAELRKLQEARMKAEIGSVSQQAEAEEKTRREAAETRKTEAHNMTMDIKKQRFEREKNLAIIASLKAGDQMAKTLPPNWQELLAAA
jgi:hypothetical protein